jgi:phytoene desaturase
MQQIIQYSLVFLGGIPRNTPALYSLMSHVDFDLGVWYPDGGMYSVVQALVRLGQQRGVEYLYSQPVTQIEVENQRVTAVHTESRSHQAEYVVSNADYQHTESLLSDPRARQYSDRYWRRRTLAPSAFILYLGVLGAIPEFAHHTLLFSRDWTSHFRDMADHPSWPREPSLYICSPSKTDPSVAPPGHENLFVLVPVAPGLSETEQSRSEYAAYILEYIERTTHTRFVDRIVVKEIFSVTDFARRYHSACGTALGLAHTLRQTALFRPPNRSRRVPNLFFVGANTTPGIGVPMCLISAHPVRERVNNA